MTSSFPLIHELPSMLNTTGWQWELHDTPAPHSKSFWLATDNNGCKWITKLRGSFRGYRELVFARLAQRLGWSCQSTVFAKLDSAAIKLFEINGLEWYQPMHWFMPEHSGNCANRDCPIEFLARRPIKSIANIANIPISHLLDWPRSEFAACLFGGNEPPGRFITTSHEFVIIDSELMFSTGPSSLSDTSWWRNEDGSPSREGYNLAYEICNEVARLTNPDLDEILKIPDGVTIEQKWDISLKLHASHKFAENFVI